jgi:rSAM/selenodomain-associated transferase 2
MTRNPLPGLAVVVPTRNAEVPLRRLLSQLRGDLFDLDVLIADAGSDDDTVGVAQRHDARVTEAEGGRGPQLRAGTEAALGDWILLLHADSVLPDGWDATLAAFIADPGNRSRAAYFRFALDEASPEARRLERMVAWRCRTLGLPYGDQGLLIARSFLDELGGVPPLPLMEDVALVRRIGKRRLVELDARLVTSADKFRRDGYIKRSARNLFTLFCYFIGVPPAALVRLYGS